MTEDLLAAVRTYSDACERLQKAERKVTERTGRSGIFDAMQERCATVDAWQTARDDLVEAAQQWAAHYG